MASEIVIAAEQITSIDWPQYPCIVNYNFVTIAMSDWHLFLTKLCIWYWLINADKTLDKIGIPYHTTTIWPIGLVNFKYNKLFLFFEISQINFVFGIVLNYLTNFGSNRTAISFSARVWNRWRAKDSLIVFLACAFCMATKKYQ